MRTQVNVRVPDTTKRQLEELTKAGYESQAHAVIVAVDRLYQQEMRNIDSDETASSKAQTVTNCLDAQKELSSWVANQGE